MKKFKKITQKKPESKIVYGDKIIENIVLLSISELDDIELISILPNGKNCSKAISVKKDKDGVSVDVSVRINYNQSVSDMAFKIQETVRHNVESMTEYKIVSVNVFINGISFEDKPQKKQKKEEIDNKG